MAGLSILIEHPGLAALPAFLFLICYQVAPRRLVLAVAIVWLCYGFYEFGMKLRLLCSGECDIRVDLLLIYPALALISLLGAVSAGRALVRQSGRAGPSGR